MGSISFWKVRNSPYLETKSVRESVERKQSISERGVFGMEELISIFWVGCNNKRREKLLFVLSPISLSDSFALCLF